MLPQTINRRLGRTLREDARALAEDAGLFEHELPTDPVTEADLLDLPPPARRWLRWAGVVGRPRDERFEARLRGRFRRGPGMRWMPCEAWQVNAAHPVGRVFCMRLDMVGVVPMVGADTYLAGRGRMHGTLLGLVTVADGTGEPFDIGELTTWLNDACVLAPSMLLNERVRWSPVDDHSFVVGVEDGARFVSAEVVVDERGALVDFATNDRFCDAGREPLRTRWTTPIDDWSSVEGRWLPTRCQAVWHPPAGHFAYVDGTFDPASLTWNPDRPQAGVMRASVEKEQ